MEINRIASPSLYGRSFNVYLLFSRFIGIFFYALRFLFFLYPSLITNAKENHDDVDETKKRKMSSNPWINFVRCLWDEKIFEWHPAADDGGEKFILIINHKWEQKRKKMINVYFRLHSFLNEIQQRIFILSWLEIKEEENKSLWISASV